MRFTIDDAHYDETLDKAQPGDELTLRVFVEEVAVDAVDVQSYGKPPKMLRGGKDIRFVVVEVSS